MMKARECLNLINELDILIYHKIGRLNEIDELIGHSCYEECKKLIDDQILECYRERERLYGLLAKLEAKDYNLLSMIYMNGMDYNEVAKLKDTNYNQVCTAHKRALERLQKIIDKEWK